MTESSETQSSEKLIHQLNSHLTVIWGYIQLMQAYGIEDEQLKAWLDKVAKEYQLLQAKLEQLRPTPTA